MSDLQQLPVHKIALGIEYDGSKYYGWQRQNEVRSVQEKLEKHFRRSPMNASRYFVPGVPMLAFMVRAVVHFETTAQRKDAAWTLG